VTIFFYNKLQEESLEVSTRRTAELTNLAVCCCQRWTRCLRRRSRKSELSTCVSSSATLRSEPPTLSPSRLPFCCCLSDTLTGTPGILITTTVTRKELVVPVDIGSLFIHHMVTHYWVCAVPSFTLGQYHTSSSVVPPFNHRRSSFSSRCFTLPQNVTSAPSLTIFMKRKNNRLFSHSFLQFPVCPRSDFMISDTIIVLLTYLHNISQTNRIMVERLYPLFTQCIRYVYVCKTFLLFAMELSCVGALSEQTLALTCSIQWNVTNI